MKYYCKRKTESRIGAWTLQQEPRLILFVHAFALHKPNNNLIYFDIFINLYNAFNKSQPR